MRVGNTPLGGVRVLDFTTLLPGPLATLILAEAGAEVVKVERPELGDDLRHYAPSFGEASAGFALLNRGKRSLALDLKNPGDLEAARRLALRADVLVEQFRPGVMERLGLGYSSLRRENPRLVYCSITGYGQSGAKAGAAGHDLNYLADSGLLSLSGGPDGAPVLPPGLIADIGGGALPAVIDILAALRLAEAKGQGCHLDVSMTDNLFAWTWWALGQLGAEGASPRPGGELLTGGSPRYQIYRTADGRFVAAAPLEEKFWQNFCDVIGLDADRLDDRTDPSGVRTQVARLIASRTAEEWRARFAERDACCTVVADLHEALQDEHFRARGIFAAQVESQGARMSALPPPLAPQLRASETDTLSSPSLGEASAADILDDWATRDTTAHGAD